MATLLKVLNNLADTKSAGVLPSVRGGSARRGMDARTDLRLVEIRERTAAAGHRLRDNLRLHLSDRTEGRGLVALSDASPQTPSPASRQSLARHHQGSSVDP